MPTLYAEIEMEVDLQVEVTMRLEESPALEMLVEPLPVLTLYILE